MSIYQFSALTASGDQQSLAYYKSNIEKLIGQVKDHGQ